MINIQSLTFEYANHLPLFQNFNWTVSRGETWSILGPSGCGKTTLLYLLAGLKFPTVGEVSINGEQITRPRPRTGLILQDYGLLPWATVRENIALGIKVRMFYGADGKHTPDNFIPSDSAERWMQRLGLSEAADQFPGQLSGGQRQRAAIARTLALEPDLLLMDEPFSSLDAITRKDLQNLTLLLCAEHNITLVIVTHSLEEAAVLGKKILLLAPAPNSTARIFNNPNAAQSGFRNAPEFHEMCECLWAEMQKEASVPA
ncbi:MAG: ABC transporter ATP-binding protein [Chloroflexi bacterium]|nr:ABC transporter ATP-binding protein [Chloroflexota bacterium]